MCPCLTNRSFAIFRASLMMMPTLETIYEEAYTIDPSLESWEVSWVEWQQADDGWGQWTEIDYEYINVREPLGPPPEVS